MKIIIKDDQPLLTYAYDELDVVSGLLKDIKATGSVDSDESLALQDKLLGIYYPVLKKLAELQFKISKEEQNDFSVSSDDFVAAAFATAIGNLVKRKAPTISGFSTAFAHAVDKEVRGLEKSVEIDREIDLKSIPARESNPSLHKELEGFLDILDSSFKGDARWYIRERDKKNLPIYKEIIENRFTGEKKKIDIAREHGLDSGGLVTKEKQFGDFVARAARNNYATSSEVYEFSLMVREKQDSGQRHL